MLTGPENNQGDRAPGAAKSIFKNPLLYSSIVLAIAILAVSWIMISRWLENRRIEDNARQQREEKQRENDRLTVEQLGGSKLAIQSFYASPASIHSGQTAQLCYDVANAKTVTLEPPAAEVWPSHFRCFGVAPQKDTSYTLTITDEAGNTDKQTVTIKVR